MEKTSQFSYSSSPITSTASKGRNPSKLLFDLSDACYHRGHVSPDLIVLSSRVISISIAVLVSLQITFSVTLSVLFRAGFSSPQALISHVQTLSVAGKIGEREGSKERWLSFHLDLSGQITK